MLYHADTLQLSWLENGIAELLFNAPGSVNKLDTKTLSYLGTALDVLQKQDQLTGLLIRSAKPAFIVGADITEFLSLFEAPPEEFAAWLQFANQVFNRLEDLRVPTVSAINGYALGGGCELILATDFRVIATDARIGLPEVKLGIMPGFGGTVRLPRLIGADNAMEMIATGKDIDAISALNLGLADAVVSVDKLETAALEVLRQAINGQLDWQAHRRPKLKALKLNRIEATMSFSTAQAATLQTAGKHYPAPLLAVKTIAAAAQLNRDAALALENTNFISLARSPEAKALVGIFLNDQYIKAKNKTLCREIAPPKQAAVLGAGIMGGGIAYQSALKGIPILMKDINSQSLTLGMNEAGKLLNRQLSRGKIDGAKLSRILTTIQPTLHYAGIEQADIVVEAVVENPRIKASVLAETEALLHPNCILASNTSTIPIDLLAKSLKRPENFCGMHFFNPVHRMPLVEIIRGKQTSDQTIARVAAYATQMGKTAIIVQDCPGFFVNRVLFPYFAGFSLLLRDGADFHQIDQVMQKEFGWPMGPAHLLDVVGIDTAHHAQAIMAQGYPERMSKSYRDAIDVLFESNRFGQKNGQGFYRYSVDKKGKLQKEADQTANALITAACAPAKTFTNDDIIARMMLPMINEVVRCLEEGIIASPAEADMALVYGLGFPPFRGGAFRYLDTMGTRSYVELAQRYQNLGPLYEVPPGLQQKAENHTGYYPAPKPITSLQTA